MSDAPQADLQERDAVHDDALDAFRHRWTHPPVDLRDVEERAAVRLEDEAGAEVRVLAAPLGAARLFIRRADAWRSRYLHHPDETDRVLTTLGETS